MKDIGIERIELCSAFGYNEFSKLADAKETKKIISDHGLKCESAHFGMRELRESQQKSIDWAKEIGMKQMMTASLGGPVKDGTTTMDAVKKAADEYNKIGAVAAKSGIQQGLHNEGFELAMVDGKRVYDTLFELLDPKLVKFQFQMSTITAGLVGADYFTKYPGRFISMHVQDVDMNAPLPPPPPPPDPNAPAGAGRGRGGGGRGGRPQKPVGQGSIDWVKTFKAAKTGGVKNYFVEQSWDLTKESVAFLKSLKV
ncbi:MAG: sugar phosphate isomerase/epimerase [Acidobacteriales bacterium]|nr:sugar phosphate isomerase/epimerase [Terriglobales bacterium]